MTDIFKHLQLTKSLDGLDLKKRLGKWDLTNISVPKPKIINEVDYNSFPTTISKEKFRFKDIELTDTDLSFSKLDYSIWENCTFNNVLFHSVSGKNVILIGCTFNNVIFENTNMMNSLLGGQVGISSGNFNRVIFLKTNLRKTYYANPKFKDCEFIDCNLKEVDFNGSRFFNCTFEGELDSVFFHGYPEYLQEDISSDLKNELYNPMENVNFSKAEMFGISFINQIDLSSCIFPVSDNYLSIRYFPRTYNIARETISFEWKGREKEIALNLIDNVYLSDKNSGKQMDFIDKKVINKMIKINGFADRLFFLLRKIEEMY